MTKETLTWTDGQWTYRLEPVGYQWRFTGTLPRENREDMVSNFGLIPGGAYVAIERLVKKASPKQQED